MPIIIGNTPFKSESHFEFLDYTDVPKESEEVLNTYRCSSHYQIIWFLHGITKYYVDFKFVDIKPGMILFVNKGAVQRFNMRGDFKIKIILFSDAFFCKTEDDYTFLKSTSLFNKATSSSLTYITPSQNTPFNLFRQIEEEWKNNEGDLFRSDILRNFLYNFLLFCEREKKLGICTRKSNNNLDCFIRFQELLEKKFREVKQVFHYATMIGVSEKRLNQALLQEFGISPKDMIDARIILEAKRMLIHTAAPIKWITFELGFTEPTNFIKYFRRIEGLTPYKFRKEYSLYGS